MPVNTKLNIESNQKARLARTGHSPALEFLEFKTGATRKFNQGTVDLNF